MTSDTAARIYERLRELRKGKGGEQLQLLSPEDDVIEKPTYKTFFGRLLA